MVGFAASYLGSVRSTVGNLRRLLAEAIKKADAQDMAAALENAVAIAGVGSVKANVDAAAKGKMLNVFVKLAMGAPEDIAPLLVTRAEQHGWSLLSMSKKRNTWWFEPGVAIKPSIPLKRLPRELYHATTMEAAGSIEEQGLTPRTRTVSGTNRTYEPRVYLATSESFSKRFYAGHMKSTGLDELALVIVDVTALPRKMKFFADHEFGMKGNVPSAVYTMSAIPASAIRIEALD